MTPLSAATDPVELDLLQHVGVLVPCATCGQHYTVNLRDVLASQEMIHEGCPVCREPACQPLSYAALADEGAAREFERAWIQLLAKVRTAGFELTFCREARGH
jgi:hypothetical protein